MEQSQITPLASTLLASKMPLSAQPQPDSRNTRSARPGNFGRQQFVRRNSGIESDAKVTDLRLVSGTGQHGSTGGMGVFYEAQEEAARRIAHRLHDESAQMLAMVYLALADIARDCPVATSQKIELVVKQLDGVREQLRGLSHDLHPPILEQFGLMPALESLANCVSKRTGLKLLLFGILPKLPRRIEIVIYRVIQEALSNVARHADAAEVRIRLTIDNGRLCCSVSDDGTGLMSVDQLEVEGHGLGLLGIHERVIALKGKCEIVSRPNRGLKLKVEIPL